MEIATAALLGLIFGHLMDLAFQRFYTAEQLDGPLYRCASCRFPLRAVFAVPVIGYLAHRGRCPDCNERLPLRAVLLPLGGAALFVASVLAFGDFVGGCLGGFFATVFLTLTFTDIDRRLLPNRIVYPSILLAIAVSWAWPDSSVVEVLAGGLVAIGIAASLLILSLPFGAGAFGLGDVKMIVLIGFVVGLPAVAVGVVIGTVAAAVFSGALILSRVMSRKDAIPHGPFLALGAVVALFWGQGIWDGYWDR